MSSPLNSSTSPKSHEKQLRFADLEESSDSRKPIATIEVDPHSLIAKATPALIIAIIVACVGSSFVFGYAIGETNVPGRVRFISSICT